MAKGLITEASSLAFPEGTTADEINFTVNRDGFVRNRRLGFDKLVTDFNVIGTNAKIDNVFYWRGPSFLCVIIKDDTPRTLLRIHAVDDDFSLVIEQEISDKNVETQIAQTTNLLVITTSSGDNPILCEYDSVANEILINDVDLYIRDFELVDDELSASERPAVLTDNHEYNLYNSGWYQVKADFNDASTRKNLIDAYLFTDSKYPSNADVPSVGIIDDGSGNIVFDADFVVDGEFGNSIAPRGHYVYNISTISRDTRLASPLIDGTPSNTLTLLGTVDLTGIPTFNPDNPSEGDPTGGGGIPPWQINDEGNLEFIP